MYALLNLIIENKSKILKNINLLNQNFDAGENYPLDFDKSWKLK